MQKKKLIICIHPYSNKGGATSKVVQLLNLLDTKKFKIIYIYLKKNTSLNLKKEIKVIKLKNRRTLFSFFEIKKILNYFETKNFKEKFLVSNQNYSNVLIYFLLRNNQNYKSILIERNHLDELSNYQSFIDFFKKCLIKLLIKFTYKYAYKVVGNSKELSKDLSNFIKKKVYTIYSPTNFKKIITLSKNYKPKNVIFDKTKVRLLSVSRFTKRKDLLTLLKAFQLISYKYPFIELILIGYGPELNNYKEFIKNNKLKNKIFLLSYRNNPYPYFLISDLYIMSSLYEGFPNSIVESIVLNVPVLSSNCKSGPSEILLNGKGGFFFKKKDYIDLASKIELFIKNKNKFKEKLIIAKKKIFRFDEKIANKEFIKIID